MGKIISRYQQKQAEEKSDICCLILSTATNSGR